MSVYFLHKMRSVLQTINEGFMFVFSAKAAAEIAYGYANNEYHLLSLDNPEIYRDLTPPEELPLNIYDDLPA